MPPKRAPNAAVSARHGGAGSRQPEPGTIGSALRNTYDVLTAQENRSVLKAVGFAGVSVVPSLSCSMICGEGGRGKGGVGNEPQRKARVL